MLLCDCRIVIENNLKSQQLHTCTIYNVFDIYLRVRTSLIIDVLKKSDTKYKISNSKYDNHSRYLIHI